jgi:hypothetical protein
MECNVPSGSCMKCTGGKLLNLSETGPQGPVSLRFRSSFPGTFHTNLGASFPPKHFSEMSSRLLLELAVSENKSKWEEELYPGEVGRQSKKASWGAHHHYDLLSAHSHLCRRQLSTGERSLSWVARWLAGDGGGGGERMPAVQARGRSLCRKLVSLSATRRRHRRLISSCTFSD